MKEMIVPMDKMLFSTDPDVSLKTSGISSNIAIVVRGDYHDEGSLKSFCGLFHWQGFDFNEYEKDTKNSATNLLYSFLDGLRIQLDLEDKQTVLLKELQFIGGEQPRYEDGELFFSGTVREVEALQSAVKDFDFADEHVFICKANIYHKPYLTSNEESLQVNVTLGSIGYDLETTFFAHDDKENSNDTILVESDDDSDDNPNSNPLFSYI